MLNPLYAVVEPVVSVTYTLASPPYAAVWSTISSVSPAGNVKVQLSDSYPEAPVADELPTAR